METKKVKISKLKLNPSNPRFIRDDKYIKLKKSIEEFPEMLELREIIVDENYEILGGNMRFRAMKELGIKECIVKVATGLTDEKKREFIAKDNIGYGEWDWDILNNEWDVDLLESWGLDIPGVFENYEPENKEKEIEEMELENECPKCGYKW